MARRQKLYSAIGSAIAGPRRRRGQAMVEFALVSTVAMFVLLAAVQLALIGQIALAVNQAAYQAARYASVNPGSDQTAITSYVQSVGPPTITNSGGKFLTIGLNPSAVPRSFTSPVTVTVAYDLNGGGKLFLPNPFLGVSLPTSLSGAATAFTEGKT